MQVYHIDINFIFIFIDYYVYFMIHIYADLIRTQQGDFRLDECLLEKDWNYHTLCQHIMKSSKIVGINVDDLPPAVSIQ